MRTKFKRWAVDYLDDNPRIMLNIDSNNPFLKGFPLEIEIGSGKGDFIIDKARRHPDTHYLAVEKVKTVATIFEQIEKGSIDKIYLNFSDPWPKKKHAKRRLTYISFLEQYYEMLKDNCYLNIKTDNDLLYEFTLEEITKSKFTLVKEEFDYIFEEDDSMSEYERKFREKGNKIHRIILKKEGK